MDENQIPESNQPQTLPKTSLKEQFTTVTPVSKYLAMVLFVALPFIGFWLGSKNGEQIQIKTNVTSSSFSEEIQSTSTAKNKAQIRNVEWKQYFDERFSSSPNTVDCGGDEQHNFSVDKVEYADLNRDGEEDAVVKYYACWNGTGGGESEVFTVTTGGKPLKLFVNNGSSEDQKRLFEGAGGHGYYRINEERKLEFEFPIYKDGDSNCCPTGGTKIIVYEWNKASQQFEVSRTAVLPAEQPSVEETTTLGAPVAILASEDYGVNLLLPGRECDKSYVIERSYNMTDWEGVGTMTFSTYQEPYDHNFRACENDYVDSSVATGTKKFWYRYGLLDEAGNVTHWSDIGEVAMEEY